MVEPGPRFSLSCPCLCARSILSKVSWKDTEKESWAVISELALGKIPIYLSTRKHEKKFETSLRSEQNFFNWEISYSCFSHQGVRLKKKKKTLLEGKIKKKSGKDGLWKTITAHPRFVSDMTIFDLVKCQLHWFDLRGLDCESLNTCPVNLLALSRKFLT